MVVLAKLSFKNGEELEPPVDASLLHLSTLIHNLLEDDESDMPFIPLPTIDKSIFELVLQYLRLYAAFPMHTITKPITSSSLSDIVQEQFVEFITSLNYRDLFQLVEVAHFLVIEPLLLLALARITFVLKAPPLEEFKRLFIFHNDLTPDEERILRKEYLEEVKRRNAHQFDGIFHAAGAGAEASPAAAAAAATGGLPQP